MSKQLGHASIKMTIDVYYKWLPGSRKDEVDELDNLACPDAAQGQSEDNKDQAVLA